MYYIIRSLAGLVLILTFSLSVTAQGSQLPESSDPAALALLKKMEAKLSAYPAVEIRFTLEFDIPGRDTESFSGTVFQQGTMYSLEFPGYKITTDGTNRWTYQEEIKEVQIYNAAGPGDEFTTPMDYLKLAGSEEYICAVAGTQKVDGRQVTAIEFKPLDDMSEFSKLRLLVNTGTTLPHQLVMFGKDASRTTLTLDSLKSVQKKPKSAFVFPVEDYPGVHVEDLRID